MRTGAAMALQESSEPGKRCKWKNVTAPADFVQAPGLPEAALLVNGNGKIKKIKKI